MITLPITQADPFLIILACADLDRSGGCWCPTLRYNSPIPSPAPTSTRSGSPGGVKLLLERRPEAKSDKNQLHLDLRLPPTWTPR